MLLLLIVLLNVCNHVLCNKGQGLKLFKCQINYKPTWVQHCFPCRLTLFCYMLSPINVKPGGVDIYMYEIWPYFLNPPLGEFDYYPGPKGRPAIFDLSTPLDRYTHNETNNTCITEPQQPTCLLLYKKSSLHLHAA